MFDHLESGIGLSEPEVLCGESEDRLAYLVTVDEIATGWADEDRQVLPDLSSIPPGPYLFAILSHVDRAKLNGFDLVDVLRARERLLSHVQAENMADLVEISYAAPGDDSSDPDRLGEAFEYASDEIRAALMLTRRSAGFRLNVASDLRERLPRVWEMLSSGYLDIGRARVFADATAHVSDDVASWVVTQLAPIAPSITAGQLKRRITKLCMSADPEDAEKRERVAVEDRRLVLEPQVDGTGDLHLLGLPINELRAIGRRVNGYMISLQKEDRSGRTHDQLRADIARDLLLGVANPNTGGKALVDIQVPVATLDGASGPGMVGSDPVTAETARHIVRSQPDAEHQITLVGEDGQPTHIYTLSRRATKRIRRHMEAWHPTCSFPGCVVPARDCDFDHEDPWSEGGETSTAKGGPKCDHDHELRDHGWRYRRCDNQDQWTSPLGHTYSSERGPPL